MCSATPQMPQSNYSSLSDGSYLEMSNIPCLPPPSEDRIDSEVNLQVGAVSLGPVSYSTNEAQSLLSSSQSLASDFLGPRHFARDCSSLGARYTRLAAALAWIFELTMLEKARPRISLAAYNGCRSCLLFSSTPWSSASRLQLAMRSRLVRQGSFARSPCLLLRLWPSRFGE